MIDKERYVDQVDMLLEMIVELRRKLNWERQCAERYLEEKIQLVEEVEDLKIKLAAGSVTGLKEMVANEISD